MIPHIRCVLLVALTVGSLGCGGSGRPELVPAEGTVILDGEPLAGAQVVFQVVNVEGDYRRPSSGVTDAQGKFRISTYGNDDGLPLGSYKVGIVKKELVGELPENYNSEVPTASGKPIKYKWVTLPETADPETSGLTAEITADGLMPDTFEVEAGGQVIAEGALRANEP